MQCQYRTLHGKRQKRYLSLWFRRGCFPEGSMITTEPPAATLESVPNIACLQHDMTYVSPGHHVTHRIIAGEPFVDRPVFAQIIA
eukprot:1824485-Rhodomonas_salina.2